MQKRILPHLAAILTFGLLTAIYFMPYYQGQVLRQGDVTQWEGMSKEILDWNKAHPDDPALWTNAMFSGMPAIMISQLFPGNFTDMVFHLVSKVFPSSSMVMFLTFVGFYVLLLCMNINPWLSMAGSVAYGLSSFTFISMEAGHNTKVQAMSMMAPLLGGVLLAYRKNILLGAALAAFSLGLLIVSNHLQVTYYMAMVIGFTILYFLITGILEKRMSHFIKASGALLIAAILAVMPNVSNLWSTQVYGKETIRGGSSELTKKKQNTDGGLDADYATRWSYGFLDGEILSILIPDIKGGSSGGALSEGSNTYQEMLQKGIPEAQAQQYIQQMPLYWGSQPFTSGPVYFGAAIVFLFLFSMLLIRNNIKWLLLAVTIFFTLLAFGHNTPFFLWLFNLLPFFNKFRTPAMALVVPQFIIPLVALMGLNELFTGNLTREELVKKLTIAAGIVSGVVVLFGVLGGMFYDFSAASDKQYYDNNNGWLIEVIKKDRASLLLTDSFRSLFFIAVAFGLVWAFVSKKLSKQIFVAGILLVFLLDGWMVAKRYLNADNFVDENTYQSSRQPTQADQDILRDPDKYYRVFNVTGDPFNEANTPYFHKSVGGYHPAKLIRYQDLIENQISKNNMSVLNMLNTKYFIVSNQQTKQPMAQRNPDALGNAWFVSQIKWAKNADEEMASLNNFDPATTAVVDERYKNLVGNWQPVAGTEDSAGMSAPDGTIVLAEYSPNKLTYNFNSTANQLTVFSDVYYRGNEDWNSYIDGKKTDHLRANYVLRALVIPAGKHTVEFRFEPKTVLAGNMIDYTGSILLFSFVFSVFGFYAYKRTKEIQSLPAEPVTKPTATPVSKPGKKK